jgi:hypothetical protein
MKIEKDAFNAALTVEIESLKARMKAARNFELNPNMYVEAALLEKQIETLTKLFKE